MTAPIYSEAPVFQEHRDVAVTLATAVTHRIVEFIPAVQQHLAQGGEPRGITARILFRLGQAGEAPVVAEVEFSHLSGDVQSFPLLLSQANGQLMPAAPLPAIPATPTGLNGGNPQGVQYPSGQALPAPGPPPGQLPTAAQARVALPAPVYGQEMIAPPNSLVSGPIPQSTQPDLAARAAQQEYSEFQAWRASQGQVAAPAVPAVPAAPVRIIRPRLPDEGGIV